MSGKNHKKPVRACLITNARSQDGSLDLHEALAVLLAQGWDVAVREKREKGEAGALAREAAEAGYDPIVNCGGDGTLSEIVNALIGCDVAVGVIPGGTENVWSKEVGISARSRVAATQLVASERVRVDAGRAEIGDKCAGHFLLMAGLGADGTVIDHVSRSLKNRLGPLAVGVAALESVPSLRAVPVQIDLDGVRWNGEVTEVAVGNTRQYGGFTSLTPDALADDGLLDVCLFTTHGLVGTGRQLASLVLRRHPSAASSEEYRARAITVHSPVPLPAQIDGSSVSRVPKDGPVTYRFSVVPRGLTLLVPRTYNGELFEHGMALNGTRKAKKDKGH